MRVLLGTCLALALAGTAPAFAQGGYGPQQGGDQSYQGDQGQGDQGDQGGQGRGHHQGPRRQFAVGDHVPSRLMEGRHQLTDYSSMGMPAPHRGEQWIHAHGQVLLVNQDGVVKMAQQRHRGHRRMQQEQGDDQGQQGYPDDSGQQGYPDDNGQSQ